MTTQEVADLTGYSLFTISKYSKELNIKSTGSGRHKVYIWSKTDLKKIVQLKEKTGGKRGRPPKKQINE
jgi:hypothetical protein